MASKRDAILASIVSSLSGAGGPSGLTVHRQRTLPITSDVLPSQLVYAISEEVATGPGRANFARKAVRKVTIAVESRVDGGTSPDNTLDPLLSWAVQKICADPTMGDTVEDCKEMGTTWAQVDADQMYGAARTDFEITYITSAADPDA